LRALLDVAGPNLEKYLMSSSFHGFGRLSEYPHK
jgi:hypothetical protein